MISKWVNVLIFTVGARIEKQDDKETHNQYNNTYINDRPLLTAEFKNKWNHVEVGSFVAKVTNEFGFLVMSPITIITADIGIIRQIRKMH